VDEPVEQRLAPEVFAREQPRQREAKRQRDGGGDERDLQRRVDRDPFIGESSSMA
jgi:hypothetical protein